MNAQQAHDAVGKDIEVDAVGKDIEVDAVTGPGQVHGSGVIVAYSVVPVVTIRRADGTTFTWRGTASPAPPP